MNRKKINAKMVDMNNIIKQLDQQTSIEYSSQEQNTFFSSVHGTFSRINHMLLLSHFSYVRLCATPQTAAHQAPLSLDSPGKNTGVGCHFLLQCMKVKSESEVAQSCLTPSNPMDCSPPGPSVNGIFQARVLEWVAIAFSVLHTACL